MQRVSTILLFTAVLAACVAWAMGGTTAAAAAFYGSTIAWVNAVLLAWRARQAEHLPTSALHATMRLFYRTALERLVVVVTLFALGLVQAHLAAAPMLLGLAAGQIVLLFAAAGAKLNLAKAG